MQKAGWKVTKTYTYTYYAIIDGDGNITIEEDTSGGGSETSGKYTITYDCDGGIVSSEAPTEYTEGEILDFPTPENEDLVFDGWYTDSTKTDNQVVSTLGMTGDITIYAKWVQETPQDFFTWSVSSGKATIKGFSTTGLEAYNTDSHEKHNLAINLVIPEVYTKDNVDYNVTAIAAGAFSGKNKIEKLVINEKMEMVESIGKDTFHNCSGLKELTVPITLNYGYYSGYPSFRDCSNIEKVTFTKGTNGEEVDFIASSGDNLYGYTPWQQSKTKVNTVIIEDGITKIGNIMFSGLSNLSKIEIPKTVKSVGENCFVNCTNLQINADIIKQLNNIGEYAFYNCSKITGRLEFSNEVRSIPNYCFNACTGITSIVIHDGIESIGKDTFHNCSGLKELTVPITLNYGDYSGYPSFRDCSNIEKVTFTKGTNGEGVDFITNIAENACGYTPWQQSRGTLNTVVIEEGITKIGNLTFSNLSNLSKIEVPKTVKSVGNKCFQSCSKLELENGGFIGQLNSVGEYAFYNCSKITGKVEFSNELKTIPNYCFNACTGITNIVFPDGLESLGRDTFYNCSGLKELTVPITLNYGYYSGWPSFRDCFNVEKVIFTKGTNGEGIDFVSSNTDNVYAYTPWQFSKSKLKTVIIGNEVTKVGNYTFYSLPNTVTYYARGASGSFTIGSNNGNFSTNNITFNYTN